MEETVTFACFHVIGALSFVINLLGLYLILLQSPFYSMLLRGLMIVLQTLYLCQNLLFTILFTPFLYPETGGGYCEGLLCRANVPFHYLMVAWMWMQVALASSFVSLIIAKHQALLMPKSKAKISDNAQLAFFIVSVLFMSLVPLTYSMFSVEKEKQVEIIHNKYPYLIWILDKKNFAVYDTSRIKVYATLSQISMAVNMFGYGTLTITIIVHTLIRLSRLPSVRNSSFRDESSSQKSRLTVLSLIQALLYTLCTVIPIFIFMFSINNTTHGK